MQKSNISQAFWIGVGGYVGSLIFNFVLEFSKMSLKASKDIGTKEVLGILTDYKNWLIPIGIFTGVFLIFFILIPTISRRVIDKKQKDFFPFPSIIPDHIQLQEEYMEYSGLDWEIFFDFYGDGKNRRKIEVEKVDGPYCNNKDKRKMNVTRTYFGKYKYKCPECDYKKVLQKNTDTLKNEVEDKLKSKLR